MIRIIYIFSNGEVPPLTSSKWSPIPSGYIDKYNCQEQYSIGFKASNLDKLLSKYRCRIKLGWAGVRDRSI